MKTTQTFRVPAAFRPVFTVGLVRFDENYTNFGSGNRSKDLLKIRNTMLRTTLKQRKKPLVTGANDLTFLGHFR